MTSKNLMLLVLAIVVLVGGYFGFNALRKAPEVTTPPVVSESSPTSSTATDAAEVSNMVTIDQTGFSPSEIKVKVGDTVSWINSDTKMHNVSSSPHPTHTDYPPLNLGNVSPGAKVSLMFDKAGTYKYHDHLNPTLLGTVTVE